jgi:hypothetical protein
MLNQAPTWLITYWKKREQMFFESMHCLFWMIANKQHTQPQKTEEDNHLHHGGNKRRKEKERKKKKEPTITQEEEPASPQLNNKEDQKEKEKQNEDSDTTAATGTTNPEDSDSSKEKGSSVGDRGIVRYLYYLAHTLKSAVWRKSMDIRKINL